MLAPHRSGFRSAGLHLSGLLAGSGACSPGPRLFHRPAAGPAALVGAVRRLRSGRSVLNLPDSRSRSLAAGLADPTPTVFQELEQLLSDGFETIAPCAISPLPLKR